jgi:hypothetical protein
MADLGTDILLDINGGTFDADAFLSSVSGALLVAQDAVIRLTTDASQLLPQVDDAGNTVEHDAIDVRALAGLPVSAVKGKQPTIVRAFAADDRITSPSVTVTTDGAQFATVTISCSGMTAAGPFRLVFNLSSQPTPAAALQIIEG